MATPAARDRRRHRGHRAAPWVFVGLLLGGWWLAVRLTGVPAYLLPGPDAVAARLVDSITNPVLWPYAGATLLEALGGCLIGAAVAIPLAILIHRVPLLDAAVSPLIGATQAIPAVALAPLLVLWIGYGMVPVMMLCALLVFFPILVSAVVGLSLVPRPVVAAARVDGAGGAALLAHIELPLALPTLLGGVRNGFALSVTGAVVGEMVMGGRGLGQLLTAQRDAVDTAGMMATILVLCAMASGLYGLVRVWEDRARRLTDPDARGSDSTAPAESPEQEG